MKSKISGTEAFKIIFVLVYKNKAGKICVKTAEAQQCRHLLIISQYNERILEIGGKKIEVIDVSK